MENRQPRKKGMVLIVLGIIFTVFQILALLGNQGIPAGYVETYGVGFLIGYFGAGIIGITLLVIGIVRRSESNKSNTDATNAYVYTNTMVRAETRDLSSLEQQRISSTQGQPRTFSPSEKSNDLDSAFEEKKKPGLLALWIIIGVLVLVGIAAFVISQLPGAEERTAMRFGANDPPPPPPPDISLPWQSIASDRLLPSRTPTTINPALVGEWVHEWDFTHRVVKNTDGTLLVYELGQRIYSNQWRANDRYYEEIFDGGDSTVTFYLSSDGNVLVMSPDEEPVKFYRAVPHENHPLIGNWRADVWEYFLNPDGTGRFSGYYDFEVKWFVLAGNRLAVYFFDEDGDFFQWWDYYYELTENNLILTNRAGDEVFYLILVTTIADFA